MVTWVWPGLGIDLSGSRCTDWLAVWWGGRKVSVTVEEEGDEGMDGRLQRESRKNPIVVYSISTGGQPTQRIHGVIFRMTLYSNNVIHNFIFYISIVLGCPHFYNVALLVVIPGRGIIIRKSNCSISCSQSINKSCRTFKYLIVTERGSSSRLSSVFPLRCVFLSVLDGKHTNRGVKITLLCAHHTHTHTHTH